jgi:hypothetical protein
MENPIQPQPLFITPDSPDDLMVLLEELQHSQAGIVQAACMAINLCHKMVQDEINSMTAH